MKSMHLRLSAIITGALVLGACTFVPVTGEGEQVRVATAVEVQRCEHLGATIVTIRERIGFVRRPPEKLAEEAEATARNSAAADWNANAIVPRAPLEGGRQVFDVYRC
ncbi:DUF4156 domain-containing protein [Thioalkalivibrio thiocyanodenitrificans]|uniref:DUF4156 domain-containing protein n=1 Tax=Thioalkalivibrio thiocyanodenitrificans TaxID=243063 RepID=UPI0003631F6A|nr:DUF4156 domain-containing protein [Thioalkalivibrio thiocyanodenitrificans]